MIKANNFEVAEDSTANTKTPSNLPDFPIWLPMATGHFSLFFGGNNLTF